MTGHAQIRHGGRADFVLVGHGLHAELHGELLHLVGQIGQRVDELLHGLVDALFFDEIGQDLAELAQPRPAVHQHFAAQQVERLNGVGALIDQVDAGVAHELLHAPFADVAVPAEHLQAFVGGLQTVVGDEGLDDGGEQRDQVVGVLAYLGVRVVQRLVEQQRNPVRQKTPAFGPGARGEQHAAHVGVHQNGIGRFVGRLRPGERTHLQPVASVGQRVLIGHLSQPERLHADAKARAVHHHEHGRQTLVGLAHHPAGGVFEGHLAGGVGVNAHLVLDAGAENAVALAHARIGGRHELGHDEQRNPLAALGRVRQLGQHHVNDVVRQVVFATGDENFLSGELVAAVGLRHGLGANQAEVGAAMRLGQAHGAGPFARNQLGHVERLLLGAAMRVQQFGHALRQAGVHGPGLIGGVLHLVHRAAHQVRQALATEFGVRRQRSPTGLHELIPRRLETLGRGHGARGGVVMAALGITAGVERLQHFAAKLARLFAHLVDQVGIDLGIRRQLFEQGGGVEDFVHDELHIAQRRGVLGHNCLLKIVNRKTG